MKREWKLKCKIQFLQVESEKLRFHMKSKKGRKTWKFQKKILNLKVIDIYLIMKDENLKKIQSKKSVMKNSDEWTWCL